MPTRERDDGSAQAEPASASVTLVAGPFTRRERLQGFMYGIRALPGIREVEILALEAGMISLQLRFADPTPALERLQTLKGFSFNVEEQGPALIRIRLFDSADSPWF